MGGKKKYINIFGSFTEPFNCQILHQLSKNGSEWTSLCAPEVIQEVNFPKYFLTLVYRREYSCATVLWFFSVASDGATTERQIQNLIFGQFCTSLGKDSVASYAWIWTLFSPSVRWLDVLWNALNISSSVGRWRHKIRKISVKILQSVNSRMQTLRKILRMVTSEIVINSLLGRLTLYPAIMHCLALDNAFGF